MDFWQRYNTVLPRWKLIYDNLPSYISLSAYEKIEQVSSSNVHPERGFKKSSIQQSVFRVCQNLCLALKAERKMIDYVMQQTFVSLAPRNEDRQSSIRPAPATASQGLNIWLHCFDSIYLHTSYSAVWTGVYYSTPKNCSPENSSQAVLNPLNAINPAFAHSTSLSLYFGTFLHGEAWLIWLSRMGDRKVGGLGKVFGSIA